MKQTITEDQLEQLAPRHVSKLIVWLSLRGYYPDGAKMNIGQMIEFIDCYGDFIYSKQMHGTTGTLYWTIRKRNNKINMFMSKELADALWKCVKSILEGKIL